MTILNVGSINRDRVLHVPHFPAPGETLQAVSVSGGLGGKGLNQSVAIIRAGGTVRHLGAVGQGDAGIGAALENLGIDRTYIAEVPGQETGSATIFVDPEGENLIVLDAGANAHVPDDLVRSALDAASPGDWLLFQNETNQTANCARQARANNLKVAFSAAPFVAGTVIPLLSEVDLLAVNAVELEQLTEALGGADALPRHLALLVTRGAEGAEYIGPEGRVHVPAHRVEAVDTTGAGDVFLGVFLAALDGGTAIDEAMSEASMAGALQVGRLGAVDVIPYRAEFEALAR